MSEVLPDSYTDAWEVSQPLYHRLPEVGYKDNPVASWLTQWVDHEWMLAKTTMEQWYRELDPSTCKETSLDYLAALLGFSDGYWDSSWSASQKRAVLGQTRVLWQYRGSKLAITTIIQALDIRASLWYRDRLVLSFDLPAIFGKNNLIVNLTVPLEVRRNSREWLEVDRVRKLYLPAITASKTTYNKFYFGFSQIGEPLYK